MASTTSSGAGPLGTTRVTIPESSQMSVSAPQDITAEDLAELRTPNHNAVDSMPPPQPIPGVDMSGNDMRFMESTRYDGVMRGYMSGPGDDAQAGPPNLAPLPQNQDALPPPPSNDWQQLYGQSENEKGEWRRLAQELGQQVQATQAQLAEVLNRQASIEQTLTQPSFSAPSQPQGPPPRIFPEKNPNELVNYGEIESIIWNEILPTIAQRDAMTVAQAKDAAAASTQRILPTWDIKPQEEMAALGQLRSAYPGFDSRFSQTERNQMILDKVGLIRSVSGANGQGGFTPMPPTAIPMGQTRPAQAPVFVDPTRAMRRATYVESAPPTQMSREPSSQPSLVDSFRAEWAAMDEAARATGRSRASAADYKRLLNKYGIQEVNDWPGGASR